LEWEPWIAKANWWFYSELLKLFEITRVGTFEIYWSPKTLDLPDSKRLANFNCLINVIDNSKTYVSIVPVDPNQVSMKRDMVFSIELAYKSWSLGPKPFSRNRVTMTPMNELVNLGKPNTFLNVGAPEKSNSYKTYLKYVYLGSNQLLVKSSPDLTSRLEVDECRIEALYDFASLFPILPESNVSFDGVIRDFKR
jgi:hypothetical protein